MPIGGSDYSHRSKDLQKLASLAGSMGTKQDNRIIVEKGGFVEGSTTAWRRSECNRKAQIEFKKILNANYGMEVADRVALDLGLHKLFTKGRHLSARHVALALEKAEAYALESDKSYWDLYVGKSPDSPQFHYALERWLESKVYSMELLPESSKKGVLKAVLNSPDIKLMLKVGCVVTNDFIQRLEGAVLDELDRAVFSAHSGRIKDFFGQPLSEGETQKTLISWIQGQFDVSWHTANEALSSQEFRMAINNGESLNQGHLDILSDVVNRLAKPLSPAFVDQSKSKVKRLSAEAAQVADQDVVVLSEEEGRKYSAGTKKAIDSGSAYGLVAYDRPEYQIEKSGVCYDSQGIERIGDKYVYVQNKRKGVEPGFEARKAFLSKDFQKVFHQPDHKYYKAADDFLRTEMKRKGSPIFRFFLSSSLTGRIAENTTEREILDLLRDEFATEIIEHITETQPKFQKIHFVKLDYKESDMDGDKVRIPAEKSKGALHRVFTAQTRKEANESAAQEAIANDLMRLMGVYTQKLKIISSEYSDGTPKLLLDGTFMKGPKGENFEDFAGCIVDGYLVPRNLADRYNNEKLNPDELIETDQSIDDLGSYLIFMLGLADRDALGSRGDNKGRCGNTFAGIDPGHSLEVGKDSLVATNLMTFENVHSDFSFDQPGKIGDKLSKGYKNFDVFQDRPYLEKMQGVKQWIALRESGEDLALFHAYMEVFNGIGKDGEYHAELDFRDKIEEMKAAYIARRDYILDEVFADRAPFLGEDHEPYGRPALEAVDALEKLTSVTSMTSKSGVVGLKYPRVVSRVQWDMSEDDDNVFFVAENPGNAQAQIKALLGDPLPAGVKFQSNQSGSKLRLVVPKEKMAEVAEMLSNEKIIQYKHPEYKLPDHSPEGNRVSVEIDEDAMRGLVIQEDYQGVEEQYDS